MTNSTNKNQRQGKGQFCLVVEEHGTKYILPLLDVKGREIGTLDYLSRVDQMTMQYKNQSLLLENYIQKGFLSSLKTRDYEVYVMSNQANIRYKKAKQQNSGRAIPPTKLKVAYEQETLLYFIGQSCHNKIQDDNYFGKKLVTAAFADITKNSAFLHDILCSPNHSNPYFSDELVALIKNITTPISNHLPISEQGQLYYEKKQDKYYLLEKLTDYKCLRGAYFAYKDFKVKNPNVKLEMEEVDQECSRMVQDLITPPDPKGRRYPSYGDDPDRNPYYNSDSFDRPEVPLDDNEIEISGYRK